MRERLIELFPEINWIKDEKIKAAVIDCHEYVLKISGWELDDYDRMPFIKSFPGCPVSCLHHTRIVTRMAKMLLEEYNASYVGHGDYRLDHDTVIAGAILHDIGKFLEWKKVEGAPSVKSEQGKLLRHPVSGAIVAAMHGLPDEIVHCIFVHSTEGNTAKRSPEAILVWKADELNFDCIRSAMGQS
ncbi:MAG: HD domain-containing protein [Holophaga sp.]|nr:HD domain-containing protein [Holophaga sp.]